MTHEAQLTQIYLDAIQAIAEGKFGRVPTEGDQVQRAFAALAADLAARGLDEVKRIVDVSSNANRAITLAAEMLQGVRATSERVHTVAAATEELSASVGTIARSAADAADQALHANSAVDGASRAAANAQRSMEQIATAVNGAIGRIDALAKASAQIGGLVAQIDAIAAQTKMLALNATIEAARAGEQGKGFAVVAQEVKELAKQTAKATEDIRDRIGALGKEMSSVITMMNDGAEAVALGRGVIDESTEDMRETTARIRDATRSIQEISTVLEQQKVAVGEITQNISGVSSETRAHVGALGGIIEAVGKANEALTTSIADLARRDIPGVTVHVAKSDHIIWRRRLAEMVVGRLSLKPEELADHHHCRLGLWYSSPASAALHGHPAFVALDEPHRMVHERGIAAVRAYNAGDHQRAFAEISKVAAASEQVLARLDELTR